MTTPIPHFIIPFAKASSVGCEQAIAQLQLQHLPALLDHLQLQDTIDCDEYSYSAPHERTLAKALQWPDALQQDGMMPWAALTARLQGLPTQAPVAWGTVTLCHWKIHADHVTMAHPADLALSQQEADKLLEAMQPWFAEEGLALVPMPTDKLGVTQWLVQGDLLNNLRTASLDRVCGRNVESWQPLNSNAATSPSAARAAPLQRLQSEMQMLLYNHPVNEHRVQQGQLPVNSFWVSGTGILPDSVPTFPEGDENANPHVLRQLAIAAQREDWQTWVTAWHWLDKEIFAKVLERYKANPNEQQVRISLCSETQAKTWGNQTKPSLWQSIQRKLKPGNAASVLRQLS